MHMKSDSKYPFLIPNVSNPDHQSNDITSIQPSAYQIGNLQRQCTENQLISSYIYEVHCSAYQVTRSLKFYAIKRLVLSTNENL